MSFELLRQILSILLLIFLIILIPTEQIEL